MSKVSSQLGFVNPMRFQQFRNGKLIADVTTFNLIPTEGLHQLLEAAFRSGSQTGTYYAGLIDNSGYSALANGDSMAQLAGTNGWREFTGYSGSNRLGWSPGAAASRAVANATTIDYTINATGSVKGGFIASSQAKGATTGFLQATAVLSTPLSVVSGDTIKLTYTISG